MSVFLLSLTESLARAIALQSSAFGLYPYFQGVFRIKTTGYFIGFHRSFAVHAILSSIPDTGEIRHISVFYSASQSLSRVMASQKHAYIILTPLNPTFIQYNWGLQRYTFFSYFCSKT